jgi:hypothetical protein
MKMVVLVAIAACGNDRAPIAEESGVEFPTLERLYDGEHGIYRGCGPNGNVCHNGNEFPNLGSLGSILDGIGSDCNLKRDKAEAVHDMCERPGDVVEIALPDNASEQIEIAHVLPTGGSYALVLRRAPTSFLGEQRLVITRDGEVVAALGELVSSAVIDPADPRSITLTMYADELGEEVGQRLARAGIPGDSGTLRVGDPNRNGVFGAELAASLIQPGDPQRSYLLRRLVDPAAGPLMPRANCCFWTKPALRALWCWVAGLREDGSNALDAIDYDTCPPLPAVELDYPDPGPSCETAGRCPVVAIGGTNEPTFASIYAEILVPACGGLGCHDQEPFGGLVDLRNEQIAYETLRPKVVSGDPDASILVRRLRPATCEAPCTTMPLDRALLPDAEVARIRQWILDGAAR